MKSTSAKVIPPAHPRVADFLRDIFSEKARKNPLYSQRAIARDLGVTHGYLSLLMSGKKKLSFKRAVEFSKLLGMDEDRSRLLLKAVALESTRDKGTREFLEGALGTAATAEDSRSEFALLELDRFKALSEWHHIAILDLTGVASFRPDLTWIAEQLGISAHQAKIAVSRLERLGLLEIEGNRWTKTTAKLAVPTTYSEKAVREFHDQMIEKAREALAKSDARSYASRDITGITMAIDPTRLPEAKKRIQKFRHELLELLGGGKCTELYQFNAQLFRLTRDELGQV